MTKKMVIFRELVREWFGILPKSVTKKGKKGGTSRRRGEFLKKGGTFRRREVLLGEGEVFLGVGGLEKGLFLGEVDEDMAVGVENLGLGHKT